MCNNHETLRALLEAAVARGPGDVALRFKRDNVWRETTYAGLREDVCRAAQVFAHLGLRPKDRLALMLDNGPEWVWLYLGAACTGLTVVPMDPKLREAEVLHVVRDAGARAIVIAGSHAAQIADLAERAPDLEQVILTDRAPPGPADDRNKPRWHALGNLLAAVESDFRGDGGAYARRRPSASDLASLIYTSGTTGTPKGVMLTHANFCADVNRALRVMDLNAADNFLVVLPLHHAFGFLGNLLAPLAGGSTATFVESLRTVGDNLRECSPTILLAVPLLVEKLHNRMRDGIRRKPLARILNATGILGPLRRGVARSLGGRLRLLIVGGAPCPPSLIAGLQRLNVPLIEGYGLTETAPVVSLSNRRDYVPGSVGRALPGVQVRIDAPNAAGVGEILVRGPIVMQGYYHRPDETAEVLSPEGWLRTGDLGRLDAEGRLSILGRKKNLIVNREGKNIYPEEVEAVINASPRILESVVCAYREGDETGERVGVIVVPDHEAIGAESRVRDPAGTEAGLQALMRDAVREACRGIADYKHPRRIQVRNEPFDKTPTLKIKRYLYAMDSADL